MARAAKAPTGFARCVTGFLTTYMVGERGLSRRTVVTTLNGQLRPVTVRDKSVAVEVKAKLGTITSSSGPSSSSSPAISSAEVQEVVSSACGASVGAAGRRPGSERP